MKEVCETYKIILDPHGAVGWRALDKYLGKKHDQVSVVYETADPGKFPEDVQKAIGLVPDVPPGMQKQAAMPERIYSIVSEPYSSSQGLRLHEMQVEEAKEKIGKIYSR